MSMNAAGTMPKNMRQRYQFGIEINGFDSALFTKGKTPTTEFEESAFKPAGTLFDLKSPGRVKFEDLTFEKGILAEGADNAAIEWLSSQADFEAGTGDNPSAFMRDVDIVEYDRQGGEVRRWTLHGAWIKKYEGDELEGGSSEPSIEKITVCYQYWTQN